MDLDVKHVAKLTRIKLTSEEESKFSNDLGKILDYFKELQKLATEDVKPLTGGTDLINVLREDKKRLVASDAITAVETFPDKENGFLKVPPVFE